MSFAASTEHKPILAERFKTKMCRSYSETGSCAYEARCMFAHGTADLRTKEMNLQAGLVTEEAIRVFLVAKMTAARQVVSADGQVRTSILAERFKTKVCQNFETKGVCPYEARCMFAHGEADLRTAAQNMAAGLTTEEAIRAFQRGRASAKSALMSKMSAASTVKKVALAPAVGAQAPKIVAAQATPMPSPAASTQSISSLCDCSLEASFAASLTSARSPAKSPAPVAKGRRHNPYAPVAFGPSARVLSYTEEAALVFRRAFGPCECPECMPVATPVALLTSPLAAVMATLPSARTKAVDVVATPSAHVVLLA